MDEVASGLFIGTVADAGDGERLRRRGVGVIVSLTYGDPDGGYPDGVTVVDVPMVDGPRNDLAAFGRAVTAVTSRLDDYGVLVHCSAGASRSPAVAATALALSEGIGLDDAFRRVAAARDAVDPHDALVRRAASVYVDRR
ncbi:protein phosphatase [Haloplanus aerogenes]|uniref:Protein phosphatase n=1 Tax=Haloplanus aerogenes TaxID=660522 RepID=A0A3G8R2E7_9EURY|nr:protein phosphatase [Haloplanus aerogenes]